MKHVLRAILFLLLAAQLLCLSAMATDQPLADWVLSEDAKTLSNGETTYIRRQVGAYGHTNIYRDTVYVSADSVYMDDTIFRDATDSRVYAVDKNPEIVWIKGTEYNYFFATEKGEASLERFRQRQNLHFRLNATGGSAAWVDSDLIRALDASSDGYTVGVYELRDRVYYTVTGHDENDLLEYDHGAIYQMGKTEYAYINFERLGNEYFDAYGNFSYRGDGTVTVIPLTERQIKQVNEANIRLQRPSPRYEYEGGRDPVSEYYEEDDSGSLIPLFWILLILFGYLTPLLLLLIGVALPRRRGANGPRYWYAAAYLAVAWLLSAVAVTLIVLLG